MRMIPIYNNVGRLLGHIEMKAVIDCHDNVVVQQDTSLKPYDPDAKVTASQMSVSICRIPKQQIRFRDEWSEQTRQYLVIESKLPDWFWNNRGCVEFWPQHFERIPY